VGFVGDAVLQLLLSEMLFLHYDKADEGMLTKIRSQLVSTKALAQIARRIQLGGFLIMGRGEESNGGRERESTLADGLEAVVGAVYIDGGIQAAKNLAALLFQQQILDLGSSPSDQNPKGQLQELLQSLSPESPNYQITLESGPDHDKFFEAVALWKGHKLGVGTGKSKKEAEVSAALNAIDSPIIPELKNLSRL